MIRGKSYQITAGTTYTLDDFGGTGWMICYHGALPVSVSIDKSPMSPIERHERFTLESTTTQIVFDQNIIITTYKES